VTAATPATGALLTDEAIIELGRTSASQHLARRDSTGLLAALFLAAAVGALFLPGNIPFSPLAVGASLLCYVLASRVQFELAGGFALPTEGVLVAMWFLVPARTLPLVVCAALVLAAVPDLVRRRMPPDRLALNVVCSWHAIGPALVLSLAGTRGPAWRDVPIYVAALAAQFAFDYASALLLARSIIDALPLAQLKAMLPSFAVDTTLAPLGLVVAFVAYRHTWPLFLLLPVLALFAGLARERQRRIDHALELSSAYRGTAMLLGDVIEADDEYTGSHSRDVVELATSVADRLGLDPREQQRAELAALLHDIGKVKIPAEIINKPGLLDDAERALINTHTIVGEQMLDQIGGLLGEVGKVVRSCHERWDGAGYPDGLAGDEIPLVARIVCACDAWSAMTTDRSYRKALPFARAIDELQTCAGTQFDPRVVDALLAVLESG
jgi:putative nucleotidyltransferase with HDIG domain